MSDTENLNLIPSSTGDWTDDEMTAFVKALLTGSGELRESEITEAVSWANKQVVGCMVVRGMLEGVMSIKWDGTADPLVIRTGDCS